MTNGKDPLSIIYLVKPLIYLLQKMKSFVVVVSIRIERNGVNFTFGFVVFVSTCVSQYYRRQPTSLGVTS